MNTEKIYLYDDRKDVTLTAYILQDSPELFKGPRPAVLICPGGGYFSCSDREAEPIALKFLGMGYQAFVLRYSTYLSGGMVFPDLSKPLPPKPETAYPKPMIEIGMAMKIITDRAEEWKVEPSKIALCGFSAGAHNAAMYSVYWNAPVITGAVEAGDGLRPSATILGYTLSDYMLMKDAAMAPFDKAFFGASNTAYLGTSEPSDDLLKEVSPALQVSENTPPMFLWATSKDNLVPVQQSLVMAKGLADHKLPFELHVFEDGQHGLSLATQATSTAKTQVDKDAAQWIDLCEHWLAKRFSFELDERTEWEAQVI